MENTGKAAPAELFDLGGGGAPALGDAIAVGKGILIEAVTTFFLVFAVFGTAAVARPRARDQRVLRLVRLDRRPDRRRHHRRSPKRLPQGQGSEHSLTRT